MFSAAKMAQASNLEGMHFTDGTESQNLSNILLPVLYIPLLSENFIETACMKGEIERSLGMSDAVTCYQYVLEKMLDVSLQ